MSSGSFGTQTQAIATTASAFGQQADPIIQQGERFQSARGTSSTTGRDYSAQGSAYHEALTGPLEKLVRSFGEKCIWVSTNLSDTQRSYEGADASGSGTMRSSGGELA